MNDVKSPVAFNKDQVTKCIGDLDELIKALRQSLRPLKPWQRQLLQQCADIERRTQVLRMTLAMGRPFAEVHEAKDQLRRGLRLALQYVAGGRVDAGTRLAIGLACDLGDRIDDVLI